MKIVVKSPGEAVRATKGVDWNEERSELENKQVVLNAAMAFCTSVDAHLPIHLLIEEDERLLGGVSDTRPAVDKSLGKGVQLTVSALFIATGILSSMPEGAYCSAKNFGASEESAEELRRGILVAVADALCVAASMITVAVLTGERPYKDSVEDFWANICREAELSLFDASNDKPVFLPERG